MPAPIAWPACEVPPPRMVMGQRRRRQIVERAENVLAVSRDDDAQRLDLIDAGVGGIERARDGIEADFAFDAALRAHGAAPRYRRPEPHWRSG